MANYFADKVILNPLTGVNTVEPKYIETDDITTIATYTAPVGQTLNAGDTIQLMDVPAFTRVVAVQVDTAKLDTGGTPALTFSLGDALQFNRLLSGSIAGQAGGFVASPNVTGVLGYTFPAVTRILATIGVGAAGPVTVTAKLFVVAITYNADV